MTGWYDNLLHEGFRLFRGWSQEARSPEARRFSKLLVGPWTHSSGHDVPSGEFFDYIGEQLRWNDRRLKGIDNGMDDEPPIRIWIMGENEWRFENEWPLARTRYMDYYIHSAGGGQHASWRWDPVHRRARRGDARHVQL